MKQNKNRPVPAGRGTVMRELSCAEIAAAAQTLCLRAAVFLPPDLAMQIECASETEPDPAGRAALVQLVDAFTAAGLERRPLAPDMGYPVFFIRLGQEVHITGGSLADAVGAGVRRARAAIPGQKTVCDPVRRSGLPDGAPCTLHVQSVPGDRLELTAAPAGFAGGEAAALRLFPAGTDREALEDWITAQAEAALQTVCPPVVVGVGLGGDAAAAMLLAAQGRAVPADRRSADAFYAAMEHRLLARINRSGVGPGRKGGRTSAIAVHIAASPTDAAALPCAVSVGGWPMRRASCVL